MYSTANSHRVIGFALTTAMAGALLAGCTVKGAAPASASAAQAEQALAKGKFEKAIAHAEAAVLAEPRNAAYRAVLGAAYLDAGRFGSAATSFDDAMQLGDTSPRTVLSLALALTGEGRYDEAGALLNAHEGEIANADYGLALALAGQPERGIHVMGNAIRGGENTAKMRQNLAYAYALAGRWREARLMTEQDVPADKVSDRIEEWAAMATPEAWQVRVAALLQVPAGVSDSGQPVQLALANNPGIDQLAEEAFAAVEQTEEAPLALAPMAELPALAGEQSVPAPLAAVDPAVPAAPASFQAAFAPTVSSLAEVAQDAMRFVAEPVVQQAAARQGGAPKPQPAVYDAAPQGGGTHLVQLGSFSSEAGAKRAWGIYTKKYPELAGHEMVISEAVVKGKRYWRVSAAGFGKSSSSSMCGRVKASGEGCFAYAEGRPLPGAVDTGIRLARR